MSTIMLKSSPLVSRAAARRAVVAVRAENGGASYNPGNTVGRPGARSGRSDPSEVLPSAPATSSPLPVGRPGARSGRSDPSDVPSSAPATSSPLPFVSRPGARSSSSRAAPTASTALPQHSPLPVPSRPGGGAYRSPSMSSTDSDDEVVASLDGGSGNGGVPVSSGGGGSGSSGGAGGSKALGMLGVLAAVGVATAGYATFANNQQKSVA
ncbi:hypothetical protein FOA52_000031 [Chlamydomonas sp. UWO 241]|nr:hypothetical protein FOA52_000031 [Chlamydomonas sp. UWO 241]